MKWWKSKPLKFIVKLIISIALLFLVFKFVKLEKIYQELSNLKTSFLVISFLFAMLVVLIKTYRWKKIIELFNTKLNLKNSLTYSLISIAFGRITPSTLGEFVRVKYLTDKTGLRYLKSFITVLVDKVFDLLAMMTLALIGLSFLPILSDYTHYIRIASILFCISIVIGITYFYQCKKLVIKYLPIKYKDGFQNMTLTRKLFLQSYIISIVAWIGISFQALFVIYALNVSISIPIMLTVVPLMALSAMAPISLGGVGVRELIAVYFFLQIGIDAEKSIIFSLFYTFIGSGLPAIIGTFLYIIQKKRN